MLLFKKLLRWIVLGCLTTVLIISCTTSNQPITTPTPADNCRTINHDADTTEICGTPQTIVSLSAHILDLLLALDQQPAAYVTPGSLHRGDTFDNPAQQIPYLGHKITTQPLNLGSAQEPSIERLTALKPDLILGETRNADEYKLRSQVAPTLLLADRTVPPGQWQEDLNLVATALGQPEKADAIIQRYQTAIQQARLDFADVVSAHPKILLLGGNRLEEGFYVIQANSYLGDLLEAIGFTIVSPPSSTSTPNAPVSLEALPDMDSADSIILGFNTDLSDPTIKQAMTAGEQSIEDIAEHHQVKAIQSSWQESAIAQSLTASQENRVYFATYAKWNGINGPTGTELVLEQLSQFFAE